MYDYWWVSLLRMHILFSDCLLAFISFQITIDMWLSVTVDVMKSLHLRLFMLLTILLKRETWNRRVSVIMCYISSNTHILMMFSCSFAISCNTFRYIFFTFWLRFDCHSWITGPILVIFISKLIASTLAFWWTWIK